MTPPPSWVEARRLGCSAGDLLEALDVRRPPVDVERIARELGIAIRRVPNPGYVAALVSCADPPAATIWLQAEASAASQRFGIAFEIGRLLRDPLDATYRDLVLGVETTASGNWADRFAADLLLPFPMMEEVYWDLRGDTDAHVALFAVPPLVATMRLLSFNGVSTPNDPRRP